MDVTEKRKTEEKLKESEARFPYDFLKQRPMPYFLVDSDDMRVLDAKPCGL